MSVNTTAADTSGSDDPLPRDADGTPVISKERPGDLLLRCLSSAEDEAPGAHAFSILQMPDYAYAAIWSPDGGTRLGLWRTGADYERIGQGVEHESNEMEFKAVQQPDPNAFQGRPSDLFIFVNRTTLKADVTDPGDKMGIEFDCKLQHGGDFVRAAQKFMSFEHSIAAQRADERREADNRQF